jgi:major membrane immunogen (membrane-anchored lipoprotein)
MSRKNVFALVVVALLSSLLAACGPDDCKPGMAVSPSTGETCPATDSTTNQPVKQEADPITQGSNFAEKAGKEVEPIGKAQDAYSKAVDQTAAGMGAQVGTSTAAQAVQNSGNAKCITGVLSSGCDGK